MKRHGIRDEGVGMDFACKTVSACFALLAASLGAIILFTPSTSKKPDKTTNSSQEGYDKSKSLLHQTVMHFMLFATAYFLYDMYAMYEVRRSYSAQVDKFNFFFGFHVFYPLLTIVYTGIPCKAAGFDEQRSIKWEKTCR